MNTLKDKITISGYGLHSGNLTSIELIPTEKYGLHIYNTSKASNNLYTVKINDYFKYLRSSAIKTPFGILTCPEHILGSFSLLNIRAIIIRINGKSEFPIAPINFTSYYKMFIKCGIIKVNNKKNYKHFNSYLEINLLEKQRKYSVFNSQQFECTVNMSNELGINANTKIGYDDFKSISLKSESISKSQTWIRKKDYKKFLTNGICKGINPKCCRILTDEQLKNQNIYNECAKHKMLDILGDLYLLGFLPKIKIKANNPNHRLNIALLHLLNNLLKDTKLKK